jgi:hypothetical protein
MSVNHQIVRLRDRGTVLGTRSLGAEIAAEIRESDPAAEALVLDFSDVLVASSPLLDEIVCAARSTIADHPGRFVVYTGLNDDVSDTLELVAERREVLLTVLRSDRLHVVGGRPYLEETLAAAQDLRTFTAPELAERLELKLPNLHQRLVQLQAAGAVTRADDPSARRGRRLVFGTLNPNDLAESAC